MWAMPGSLPLGEKVENIRNISDELLDEHHRCKMNLRPENY